MSNIDRFVTQTRSNRSSERKSRDHQSRTQSLQAFWSAGQRREDSGDIKLIDFLYWLCLSERKLCIKINFCIIIGCWV